MTAIAKIGWKTACTLVISNMVGTGVFTSLGFQLLQVQHPGTIALLWLLGGAFALVGAFTFAELGTHYGQRGGDFIFISEGLHPLLGYLSAWTSLIVGFSAPVAIGAIAMADYLAPLGLSHGKWWTGAIVLLLCLLHSYSLRLSGRLQWATTLFKLALLGWLIALGLLYGPLPGNGLTLTSASPSWPRGVGAEVFSSGFAVSLLYVSYAYSGWNAAAYIVDEIDQPRQNLPRALIGGTVLVTVAYVALQLMLLKLATPEQLRGQTQVVPIAVGNVLGPFWAKGVSLGIALQLVATMSAYLWVGSRIVHSMSLRYPLWAWLRPTNQDNIPVRALWALGAVALGLLASGQLDRVLIYTAFVLQLMATLAIASLLRTPRRVEDFPCPGRPYGQWLFIGFNCFSLIFTIYGKPIESLLGLGTLAIGVLTYWWDRTLDR
jgi:amino acid transporter